MFPVGHTVPLRYPPVVTWCLIGLNCLVFLYEVSLPPTELEQFALTFALVPARYFTESGFSSALSLADYIPFLTNMFLHGGWGHLIINMWSLWLFGGAVEDRFGRVKFLIFYLACGVLASLTHAVFNPNSVVPALGASGAIAGVLGSYMRLFPQTKIIVLVPILFLPLFFDVPAAIFAGLWFLSQILQGTADIAASATGAGVAWWAHVGGFIAGLILSPLLVQPGGTYRPHYADEGVLGFTSRGR
jgi:membrane associated rhomboid family serine protease